MKQPKKKILITIDWFLPGTKSGGPVRSYANMLDHLGAYFDFYVIARDTDFLSDAAYKGIQSNAWNTINEYTQIYYFSKEALNKRNLKALLDNNKIIMFTRSPIFTTQSLYVKRHIGVYGFSKAMTEKIDKNIMIETSNEIVENLEQIRWGDNGISFNYARAAGLYKGIDTQKDLDYVRTFLN